MLIGFLILLVFQLIGELIVLVASIPVPGPVVGMVLLLGGLIVKGEVPECLRLPSEALLKHLALLFVPAGVGLMVHFSLIRAEWLAIMTALIVSTLVTLIVTGLVLNRSSSRLHQPDGE